MINFPRDAAELGKRPLHEPDKLPYPPVVARFVMAVDWHTAVDGNPPYLLLSSSTLRRLALLEGGFIIKRRNTQKGLFLLCYLCGVKPRFTAVLCDFRFTSCSDFHDNRQQRFCRPLFTVFLCTEHRFSLCLA